MMTFNALRQVGSVKEKQDRVHLTCSKNLTGSQLSLPRGMNKKIEMRN